MFIFTWRNIEKFHSRLTLYSYFAVHLQLQDNLEEQTVDMFQLWVP